VAGKKPRKSKTPSRLQRGDLEAFGLVLLALAFFLGVSLYPDPPLSGALGQALRDVARRHLGYLAYLLPWPLFFSGLAFLFQKPQRALWRHSFFALLAGAVASPLVAALWPEAVGVWSRLAHDTLVTRLGPTAYLLDALALWAVVDLWMRKPPLWGLTQVLKRVGQAAGRLFRSWRSYRGQKRDLDGLRRQARTLLAQVRSLHERYPDHAALEGLKRELERIVRHPGASDPEELEHHRTLLGSFLEQRARELEQRLRAEAPPLLPEIEAQDRALEQPLAAESALTRELEARREALRLELAALKKRYADLQAASDRDAVALARDPAAVARVSENLQTRAGAWRELEEIFEEVANRTEAWHRWVDWARSQPEAYHEAALQLLKSGGLTRTPPAVEAEDAQEQPKPPPAEPPAPKKAKRAATQPKRSPAPGASGTPPLDLLDPPEPQKAGGRELETEAARRAEIINETLAHFNLQARVVAWARGPSVTRFEVEPAPGEKISRIAGLANDIARALAVGSVRVEAPIPGKHVIGLEVPNAERELVHFSEALTEPAYQRNQARLPLVLGKSIDGEMWVRDLAGMPHLLIAGSTGSGKSVCVNTLVMSLLYRYPASQLRFLMIDPKMVELTPYDGIPHLVRGVVTNPADAAGVLLGAVAHMERRYKMMSQVGARNLEQFNAKMRELGEPELPLLVIVIDELADLMITSPKEVEQAILRLAQMARATGMHLILATQRPSVDILTSLIKVNIPARIAFAVSSSHDSRTILDSTGAERLIGQGDMLFHQPGLAKPVRLQGPFLSDREIRRITDYLRELEFEDTFGEAYGADFDGPLALGVNTNAVQGELPLDFSDPYLKRAAEIVVEEGQASVSRLQRRLSVGHARAGKLMDLLEAMGIVGPHQGSKPREVLITPDQLDEYFG